MITNKTVVISCAGMGKRLGIGTTKALVNVGGKPLIIRALENLSDVEDVRIVVGFQAEKVIELVKNYRKDVTFVFNHNFMNTGTAGSVSLALDGAREYILTVDGDIIINPEDYKLILNSDFEFVCGSEKCSTDNPVLLSVNDLNEVIKFSRESGDYEWTGVSCIKMKNLKSAENHVYQMIEPLLPKKFLKIRIKEIDTLQDFQIAKNWIKNNYGGGYSNLVLGILGGMGSYATLNMFAKILEKFPAEKEWERPRIIIDNNCTMPSRVRAILYGENEEKLIYEMSNSLNHLVLAGATDIILACNTSHVFLEKIYKTSPGLQNYIHNIVELTADYFVKHGIQKAYLVASEGTIISKIFDNYFSVKNITLDYNENDFTEIREFIECVKQNKISDEALNNFADFINFKPDDYVILGCTELPILYDLIKEKINKKCINPLEIGIDAVKAKFKGNI